MKKFLLVASAITVVTLLAAPAFAEGPADHGGSDNAQGSSGSESGADSGSDKDPAHYHHDGNDEERQPNRRTEITFDGARQQGGASGGKK